MDSQSVLIDGVIFENSFQRGIQRYYFELLQLLPEDLKCTLFLDQPAQASMPEALDFVCRTERFAVARWNILGRACRKFKIRFQPTPLPKAKLFHSTFFTRSPVFGLPEVVTVHDMIAECHPQNYPAAVEAHVAQKKECLVNASAIIAISEATRNDLVKIYPEVSDRVTVIHHGADHFKNSGLATKKPDPENPYVLFVGDRPGYKNFAAIVAALTDPAWPRHYKLKVVGAGFLESELKLLQAHGVDSKITHLGRVADEELKRVYQGASAFIFPSLCEGFGFPLLEAQHMGVPVIASDIPVFREIGGDSVIFFNPDKPATVINALTRILEAGERNYFVTLGRENVKRFTWEKCAQQTAEVFRAAALL